MERPPYGPRVKRRRKPVEDAEVDTAGHPGIAVVGWALMVAGPICLFAWAEPQWRLSMGHGFLTFRERPAAANGPGGWGPVFVLLGPMVGLNVVFFGTGTAHRRVTFAVITAMLALELATVVTAVVWAVGAGLPSGLIFDPSGDSGALVPLVFVLGICTAAAGIMGFGPMKAADRRPWSLRSKVVWLAAAAVVWVLCMVPAWLASGHALYWGGTPDARPWPRPWEYDNDLAGWTIMLTLCVGVFLGTMLSMVVKAVAYRRWLRAFAQRSGTRSGAGWRLLRFFQHWPIVLAVVLWGAILGSGVPDEHAGASSGSLLIPALVGLVPFGLGVLMVCSVWRTEDVSHLAPTGITTRPARSPRERPR